MWEDSLFHTTESDLQDAFAVRGGVAEVNLFTDRTTGVSKGFGFVTMNTGEEAQNAMNALKDSMLDGRRLTVKVARPPEKPRRLRPAKSV